MAPSAGMGTGNGTTLQGRCVRRTGFARSREVNRTSRCHAVQAEPMSVRDLRQAWSSIARLGVSADVDTARRVDRDPRRASEDADVGGCRRGRRRSGVGFGTRNKHRRFLNVLNTGEKAVAPVPVAAEVCLRGGVSCSRPYAETAYDAATPAGHQTVGMFRVGGGWCLRTYQSGGAGLPCGT